VTKEDSGLQVSPNRLLPTTRERVGLFLDGSNATAATKTIVAAEAAGVQQIWMVQPHWSPDVLTTFAAAATKTSSALRSIHCVNLSTPSTRYGTTGSVSV